VAYEVVVVILRFPEPSNVPEPVVFPVRAIVRAVANLVAVPAFPETDPVIVEEKVLVPAIVWSPLSFTVFPSNVEIAVALVLSAAFALVFSVDIAVFALSIFVCKAA
jgi:hypothetical protein